MGYKTLNTIEPFLQYVDDKAHDGSFIILTSTVQSFSLSTKYKKADFM